MILDCSKLGMEMDYETKEFLNDLFGWRIKHKDLKDKFLPLASFVDSLTVFGVYSYVRPVFVNGKNMFTTVTYCSNPQSPREIYEIDLSKPNPGRDKPVYFETWDAAFVALAIPSVAMVAKVLGKNEKNQQKLMKKTEEVFRNQLSV